MNASFERKDSGLRNDNRIPTSAFDESVDNTIHVSSLVHETGNNVFSDINKLELGPELAMLRHNLPEAQKRWKSEGPWLASMTEDEFETYLHKLRTPKHREGFLQFVGNVTRQEKRKAEEARVQQERGITGEDAAEIEAASQLRAGELEAVIKTLREGGGDEETIGFSSPMATLMREYLDLPGFVPDAQKANKESNTQAVSKEILERSMSIMTKHVRDMDIQPPPVTHLSGGLSYIRTKAYLENHPVWGPQVHHTPVEARVVRPSKAGQTASDQKNFMLGLGGFITADPSLTTMTSFKPTNGLGANPTEHLEDVEGGTKVWVNAIQAYMDKAGRVHIQFDKAQSETVGVKTGNIPQDRLHDINPLDSTNFAPNEAERGTPDNGNYGTSLPGTPGQAMNRYRPYRPRPDVKSFDSEKIEDRNAVRQLLADQYKN